MGKLNWCRMLLLRRTDATGACELDSRAQRGQVRAGGGVGAFAWTLGAALDARAPATMRGLLVACVALALAACSGAPTKSDRAPGAPAKATSSTSASNADA